MELLVTHPIIFFLVTLVIMSLAAWLGATVLRGKKPLDDLFREDFSIVQSATLTLLALVIGFSLSMAVGRYDQRKNYEEEEANAIGTEFLRADLLPASEAAATRTLLLKYLDQRVQYYRTRDSEELAQIGATTSQLQTDMWTVVRSGAATQPNPLSALAVAGMNDVINTQGYTQAAWWNRVPFAAWALLISIGVFCNLLVGYGSRTGTAKARFLLVMPLVVSLSFMLIADIDSPRNGIIRVAPQNLISLAQSLPKP
ncbi:bestrophin-like domain [Paraburkholderia saeva]|jgi:hypothetical protein|uniref:DUF4239 domain-containing protein n=1 Tax=Paraburkholderia saeva TaxID=2777537 RepID=A0A9N8S131_9BURK|nr:hypothetical protein [Paraburkholderia saeva]CAG4888946.1 hypothetical protein R52603_00818 [Paraburkholderia saeva]CAG4894025.1 hypothetical protein R70241_01702 [Paraburkholderia saeva]CAG4916676.1 hypothetical protein LMG31841_04601 [Paraburkholderia saeva]